MTTDPRIKFLRTDESLLNKQIKEQIKIVFERRFGRKYTDFEFDALSRTEQDWVITEAGKMVQRIRSTRTETDRRKLLQ